MFRVWRPLLGVDDRMVLEHVELDDAAGVVVAHVRPKARQRRRCGVCGRRSPWYDRGQGRRRWRGLDLGTVQVFVEADAPRVTCQEHGVTVARVPWARHGSRHTRAFEDTATWLVTQCSKTAVTALLRIGWRTVGSMIERVMAEIDAQVDRLDGLTRIGMDEISYKKGQNYLTVVVDHDSGRLVWVGLGRQRATIEAFFDDLGEARSAQIAQISADGAEAIASVAAQRAPQAVLCADPFHVIKWATECLDDVRRQVWNQARQQPGGMTLAGSRVGLRYNLSRGDAKRLQRSRWALWKANENLTVNQRAKLDWIAKTSPLLHRAYLLKEGLRFVFKVKGEAGKQALDRWLVWAQRSRIPAFVELGRKIKRHLPAIHATLDHGLSNGLIESTNTKIRLLTRIAFGFKNPHALMALAMLSLGGYRPALPGR
jgi:transposase